MIRLWIAALTTGLASLTAVAAQDTVLEFEDAWVRALPPSQRNTAAYFTVVNQGDVAVAITGAHSDVAEKVELHTTREVDGLMRMEQLQGLAVAPAERLELAPGGTHLMLLGLKYMPEPGDDVQLCLQLATGGEACTTAEVRSGGGEAKAQGHQHHHPTNE